MTACTTGRHNEMKRHLSGGDLIPTDERYLQVRKIMASFGACR
jgi:hypothetical protein